MNAEIRVFPRRTNATPDDPLAFVGYPPLPNMMPETGDVRVSCTFTWDIVLAEKLARAWGEHYPNVTIGGPAFDDPGGSFVPGRFLADGYVITSRGCPGKCNGCFVPRREGEIRLLPITDGWLLHDNNILACPDKHIADVWAMLAAQPQRPQFPGGIESARVTDDIARMFADIHTEQLFLAYDRPEQRKATAKAISRLRAAGLRQRAVRCYVLVNYDSDNIEDATDRLQYVFDCGGAPFAMYYQAEGSSGAIPRDWRQLVRKWRRPAIMFANDAPDDTPAESPLFEVEQ